MNYSTLDKLELNSKVLIKAWDHENQGVVETVATYLGWCDHPDWGTAVAVSYENKNCHFDDIFNEGQKETETDVPVGKFLTNVIRII
jgi:hypothetical protein